MQPRKSRPARVRWGLLAVLALVVAAAYPMQVNGFNQNSHYALVRAFADGTPTIDKSRNEVGELSTLDASIWNGHWYSNKAPGLAIVTIPAFAFVERIGMRTVGDPTRVIWALHLWSIVLPFALLLLLVRRLAEELEPGFGTAAAALGGLGTLLLPFSTLFFSHVLAAALGFVAFAVLWRERAGAPRLALVSLAGVLAGFAVTIEYSLLLLAAVLAPYALWRARWTRRAVAYVGGASLGVLPLLLYRWWAFRDPFHNTYEGNQTGDLGGFYGSGTPSLGLLSDLLFSAWGLVTLTPVIACGVAGAIVAYRRGWKRPEALLILAVVGVYLAWASTFRLGITPFGGLGAPRYLITIMPFAALPLAVALRAFPATTLALGAVSVFQMAAQTATNPLAMYDGDWLLRLQTRDFSQGGSSLIGITGWYAIAPFFLAVLVALAAAFLASGRVAVGARDAGAAVAALTVWGLIALTADNPAGHGFGSPYVIGTVGVLALATAGLALLAGPGASRGRLGKARPPAPTG